MLLSVSVKFQPSTLVFAKSIKNINLCQAQLVLQCLTVSRVQLLSWDIYLGMQTASQVNSAWPSPRRIGAMSTSQRVVMPCGWGVKAGMVFV